MSRAHAPVWHLNRGSRGSVSRCDRVRYSDAILLRQRQRAAHGKVIAPQIIRTYAHSFTSLSHTSMTQTSTHERPVIATCFARELASRTVQIGIRTGSSNARFLHTYKFIYTHTKVHTKQYILCTARIIVSFRNLELLRMCLRICCETV